VVNIQERQVTETNFLGAACEIVTASVIERNDLKCGTAECSVGIAVAK
jgi:hypothetical protein